MLEKLNKQFIERYSKQFLKLNSNLYKAAKDDEGNYEVPVPGLSDGGFTVVDGKPTEAFSLNPPALANVTNKKVKAKTIIYRIAIPISEAQIAADKPEYFKYLFDSILKTALKNYYKLAGNPEDMRFGDVFVTADRPGGAAPLKELSPNPNSSVDDQVELRLYGQFAGSEEV